MSDSNHPLLAVLRMFFPFGKEKKTYCVRSHFKRLYELRLEEGKVGDIPYLELLYKSTTGKDSDYQDAVRQLSEMN